LRVGAGAQFIQDDQRLSICLIDDMDDIGHVPGEGGKRLFDRLFIADVGINIVKDADLSQNGLGCAGRIEPSRPAGQLSSG
jgi:hypothetical protein